METYYIINKQTGYVVKSFSNELQARKFAETACKANNNTNFIVCVKFGGYFNEI